MRRPEFIARQSACPRGPLGWLVGRLMARETVEANRIALELLALRPTDHVLEVGFGYGETIARVAAIVGVGFVAGVDHSAEMVRMALGRNRHGVAQGRVDLRQALAECLPFPDGRFDRVLSVYTLYFWSDPACALAEMCRVLRLGGRLVLAYRNDSEAVRSFPSPVYRFYEDSAVLRMLEEAGFEPRIERRSLGRAPAQFAVAVRSRPLVERRPRGSPWQFG